MRVRRAASPAEVKRRKHSRWDLMSVSTTFVFLFLGATFFLVLVAGGVKLWRYFADGRAEQAELTATAAAMGDVPTVASILSARAVLLARAREHGAEVAVVVGAIEHRTTGEGLTRQVVAFHLCTGRRHVDVERALPRSLTREELAALALEGIKEHKSDHWKYRRRH